MRGGKPLRPGQYSFPSDDDDDSDDDEEDEETTNDDDEDDDDNDDEEDSDEEDNETTRKRKHSSSGPQKKSKTSSFFDEEAEDDGDEDEDEPYGTHHDRPYGTHHDPHHVVKKHYTEEDIRREMEKEARQAIRRQDARRALHIRPKVFPKTVEEAAQLPRDIALGRGHTPLEIAPKKMIDEKKPKSLSPVDQREDLPTPILPVELSLPFLSLCDAMNVMFLCKSMISKMNETIPRLIKQSLSTYGSSDNEDLIEFFRALVERGNENVVKWFKELNLTTFFSEYLDDLDDDYLYALTIAGIRGHKKLVDTILAEVPRNDIGGFNNDGYYDGGWAVYHVSREGKADVLDSLINAGAKFNECLDNDGFNPETPLFAATWCGKIDTVKCLLTAGADPNSGGLTDASNCGGLKVTPLLVAIGNGREDLVRTLIPKNGKFLGADVNRSWPSEPVVGDGVATIADTPLTLASQLGQKDIVKILLDAGADPNKLDDPENFNIGAGFDDTYYTPLLINPWWSPYEKKRGASPIWKAAYHGRKDVVELLIDAGANVNESARPYDDNDGHKISTLFTAVLEGHKDITAKLIDSGAHITDIVSNVTQTGHKYIIEASLAEGEMVTTNINYQLSLFFILHKLRQTSFGLEKNYGFVGPEVLKYDSASDDTSSLASSISLEDRKALINMIKTFLSEIWNMEWEAEMNQRRWMENDARPKEQDMVIVTGGIDVGVEGELLCIDGTDSILKDVKKEVKSVDYKHLAKISELSEEIYAKLRNTKITIDELFKEELTAMSEKNENKCKVTLEKIESGTAKPMIEHWRMLYRQIISSIIMEKKCAGKVDL